MRHFGNIETKMVGVIGAHNLEVSSSAIMTFKFRKKEMKERKSAVRNFWF
jgi:hypothetical protein